MTHSSHTRRSSDLRTASPAPRAASSRCSSSNRRWYSRTTSRHRRSSPKSPNSNPPPSRRHRPSNVHRPQPEQLADADRLPPPPLYQCNTWDNQNYLSEDADPKPRCVQLQTTGLAGDPNRAGGQACEMKYDRSEEHTSELQSLMRNSY